LAKSGGEDHLTSESGLTLIELLVAMMVTAILLTVTLPVINAFVMAGDKVESTYAAVDQILPLSATLPRFLRSAVEPAPSVAGVPVPPFVVTTSALTPVNYGPYVMSFYSNVGDSNGPARIKVTVTGSVAPYTLKMTETPANAGSCPGVNPPPATTCTYSATPLKLLATVNNLVNGPGSGTPIFTYSTPNTGIGTSLPQDSTPFITTSTNCGIGSTTCLADQINYVTVTLQAQIRGAPKSTISSSLFLLVPTYSAIVG
jgi:prepilin-type N-terminal cleavage/methylation domain-containing protein